MQELTSENQKLSKEIELYNQENSAYLTYEKKWVLWITHKYIALVNCSWLDIIFYNDCLGSTTCIACSNLSRSTMSICSCCTWCVFYWSLYFVCHDQGWNTGCRNQRTAERNGGLQYCKHSWDDVCLPTSKPRIAACLMKWLCSLFWQNTVTLKNWDFLMPRVRQCLLVMRVIKNAYW